MKRIFNHPQINSWNLPIPITLEWPNAVLPLLKHTRQQLIITKNVVFPNFLSKVDLKSTVKL